MRQTHNAIGILGGTFDPIHFGHLRMALELYQVFQLARVHIIPTYQPMYRHAPVASPAQRLNMIQCAIQNEAGLVADDREIKRQGPTYTIDTLAEMRKEMPDHPLCLLIGVDAFLHFLSWHRFEEILDHAHIIIAYRPHYHLPRTGKIADLIKNHFQHEANYVHEHRAGGILLQPITALEISATYIRNQIVTGKDPRYLLPDDVYHYIQTHQIYTS